MLQKLKEIDQTLEAVKLNQEESNNLHRRIATTEIEIVGTQVTYAEDLTLVFVLAKQTLYQLVTLPDHTLASSHWKYDQNMHIYISISFIM